MSSVHDPSHYPEQSNKQTSASVPLEIPQALLHAIQKHGEEFYPNECCGILLGVLAEGGLSVREVIRAGNTHLQSARSRYHIEPADLLRAQREGRARSLEVVGFYHSHPDHPAFWSPTDLREAHWFDCAYVITSIDGSSGTPRAHETRSFLLTGSAEEDKRFQNQPIRPIEASTS